ncbi:MAG: hypothetical protein B7Y99_00100 [Caulobacterales bacterium 32-69-10]|nr:MAG: hypothetical protein B7Y99_00100 [Caulobacterales bacterium 32-69-10]
MTRSVLCLLLLSAVAACSPEPRSADYFVTHQEEAAQIVAACATGAHRGDECVNAKAGVAAAKRDERMDAYKKNF